MYPSKALSWGLGNMQVVMYPSKSDGMFVPESLIFRSDSNGATLAAWLNQARTTLTDV